MWPGFRLRQEEETRLPVTLWVRRLKGDGPTGSDKQEIFEVKCSGIVEIGDMDCPACCASIRIIG